MDKYVPLLTRVIEVANHYSLVDQVVDVLNQYMISRSDPQVISFVARIHITPLISSFGGGSVQVQSSV